MYEVVIKLIVICFENNIKCSLNVNKQIPVDRIGQCGVKAHDIHGYFHVLMVGQRTLGFWGVTAWYKSIGIRIPRLDGMGLDHYIHCAFHAFYFDKVHDCGSDMKYLHGKIYIEKLNTRVRT